MVRARARAKPGTGLASVTEVVRNEDLSHVFDADAYKHE